MSIVVHRSGSRLRVILCMRGIGYHVAHHAFSARCQVGASRASSAACDVPRLQRRTQVSSPAWPWPLYVLILPYIYMEKVSVENEYFIVYSRAETLYIYNFPRQGLPESSPRQFAGGFPRQAACRGRRRRRLWGLELMIHASNKRALELYVSRPPSAQTSAHHRLPASLDAQMPL